MMYSVWDHAARTYHYYETPDRSAATSAPKPAHLRSVAKLGLAPEQAAWPLPSGAKLVGRGKYPKGMIASRHSGLGIIPIDLTPVNMIILGGLGWLLYKHWRK
jgi:hypothetical protein